MRPLTSVRPDAVLTRKRRRVPAAIALATAVTLLSCSSDGGTGPAAGLRWASIAAGVSHTCALTSDGAAYCWGYNRWGQLGDGTILTSRDRPTEVSGGLLYGAISAGDQSTWALTTSGQVYSWGVTPRMYSLAPPLRTVSAGTDFACSVNASGTAYCWGNNSSGQLGDGTTTSHSNPSAVAGALVFRGVSAGYQHACGVTDTGSVYCWGRNGSGQLGDGTTTLRTVPTKALSDEGFRVVGVGWYHSCALATSGVAYCWGSNGYGQLGDGTTASHFEPAPVTGAPPFDSLTVGAWGACGLTSGGAAWCWGGNASTSSDTTTGAHPVPTLVAGGLAFASLSAGGGSTNQAGLSSHTCGITRDGRAYCWGGNFVGQLGIGSPSPLDFWPPAAVGGNLTFQSLAAGMELCGLGTDGVTYCWGETGTPAPLQGGATLRSLSIGTRVACGLDAVGAAHCWGANDSGQVGDGTTIPRSTPTPVAGGLAFGSVSAGATHACGVASSGSTYCWGANGRGQLGDGTTASRDTAAPVAGAPTFSSVSVGTYHSCALTASGDAYCWGDNQHGELGDLTTTDRSTPTAVAGGLSFSQIVAGWYVTCAVTPSGAGYCWGWNCCGQLGHDTGPSYAASPTRVDGTQTYRSIDTRDREVVCGLTIFAQAYCWGTSGVGNLIGTGYFGVFPEPTPVVGGLTFQSLTVGGTYVCGLSPSGTAYCWGTRYDAQRMGRTFPQWYWPLPVEVALP